MDFYKAEVQKIKMQNLFQLILSPPIKLIRKYGKAVIPADPICLCFPPQSEITVRQ